MLCNFQRRWVEDDSRFKIGMFARQTGKTFGSTLEIVQDSIEHKTRWVILSRGERQAKEAMDTGVKRHLEAYSVGFEYLEVDFDATLKALEVNLPNGSRITALPANPDTARGFSANVLLDEFAFHKDSYAIWKALFPVISAGYKLRVVSTPNGKQGKFYELMTSGVNEEVLRREQYFKTGSWSVHFCNIYQAVADGLDRDIAVLRGALNDEDAWATEYELQWLDSASAWLDYDLIANAEVPNCLGACHSDSNLTYLGWDIARRRDLSVKAVVENWGGTFWVRALSAKRQVTFDEQNREFRELMAGYRVRRAAIDQTGMGEPIVEGLRRNYGSRVEGVIFSGTVKQDLAVKLKQLFEDNRIKIPVDRALRESLHSIRKTVTSAGNVRFDAETSETTGHGDYFWALALAIHAADRGCEVSTFGVERSLNLWRGY